MSFEFTVDPFTSDPSVQIIHVSSEHIKGSLLIDATIVFDSLTYDEKLVLLGLDDAFKQGSLDI